MARRQRKPLRQRAEPLSGPAPASFSEAADRRPERGAREPDFPRERQRRGDRPGLPDLLPAGPGQRGLDRPDLRHVPRGSRHERRGDARGGARRRLSLRPTPCWRQPTSARNCCGSAPRTTPRATPSRPGGSNGCCANFRGWWSSTKPISTLPPGRDFSAASTNSEPDHPQTFSKAWGMAGIRLGMAFASEP